MPLSHEDIPTVLAIASEQIGEGWRLPSKDELLSLVCEECGTPTIDPNIFPNTEAVPYWTRDPNQFAPNKYFERHFGISILPSAV